jgi:hypothetical protein
VLCVGWPGVQPKTFEPGKPFRLAYRVWVHGRELDEQELDRVYEAYVVSLRDPAGSARTGSRTAD